MQKHGIIKIEYVSHWLTGQKEAKWRRKYYKKGILLTAALRVGNIVDTMLVGSIIGPDAMSAVKSLIRRNMNMRAGSMKFTGLSL